MTELLAVGVGKAVAWYRRQIPFRSTIQRQKWRPSGCEA